tara:strand:+ start:8526 stop:8699 length:174 start_codon:yes stop_codon:yes gene_type:complete
MERTLLFIVFIFLTLSGSFLISKKSGNHDIDFFMKIIGWILLIPGLWGILESLQIIN